MLNSHRVMLVFFLSGLILLSQIASVESLSDFPIGLVLEYWHEEHYESDYSVEVTTVYNITRREGPNVEVEHFTDGIFDFREIIDFPDDLLLRYGAAQLWADTSEWALNEDVWMALIEYRIVATEFLWDEPYGPYECFLLRHSANESDIGYEINLLYDIGYGILIHYDELVWMQNNFTIVYEHTAQLVGHNMFDFETPVPTTPAPFLDFYIIGIVIEIVIILALVLLRMKSTN